MSLNRLKTHSHSLVVDQAYSIRYPFAFSLNCTLVVLDTLRRQRNVSDYTGDEIDLSTVEHCITEAVKLIDEVLEWRSQNRPALIAK